MSVQTQPLATMFTDAGGQVVFVDQHFLRMLGYHEAGVVAGEPLHKALRLEQKIARQMLEELHKIGKLSDKILEVLDERGKKRRIALTAIASFDDRGGYIGADITLQALAKITDTAEITIAARGDVVKTQVQQAVDAARVKEEAQLAQVYFTAQMQALYVLMGRLVGKWVRKNFDGLVNETAAKQGWQISMRDGLIEGGETRSYSTILNASMKYAAELIGEKVVLREMTMVDQHVGEHPRLAAQQHGLRAWVRG